MFLNGVRFTGIAIDHWPDGAMASEVAFEDGIQHGLMRGWHPNGALSKEIPYVRGCVRGVMREWHKNGQMKREAEVGARGEVVASKEFDEDGRLFRTK
jgi:antitoxin component YwqK of YwqJK toxin-antitoxin module